jgi:hypothetical protein
LFVPREKKTQLPIAAAEIEHLLAVHAGVGECIPTARKRTVAPIGVGVRIGRALRWFMHEPAAERKAQVGANIHGVSPAEVARLIPGTTQLG